MADTQTDDIRANGGDSRQLQTRRQSPPEQTASQPPRPARSKTRSTQGAVSQRSTAPASAPRNGAALAYRARPRGLWAQIWAVLLQPSIFFRSLPEIGDTRQWLWVLILILALTGFVAVREQALLAEAEAGGGAVIFPPDMGMIPEGGGFAGGGGGGGGGVAIEGDPSGGVIGGEFGPPPGFDAGGGGGAAEGASVTENLTTALLAASNVLVGWGVLTVLLSEVSLFNGRAPRLGQNFHIAIWAAVPFALMAALKLIFYASGGEVGQEGIAGIVTEMPFYAGLSGFAQSLTLSLASRLTLFWLWSLILIYFGARYALNGKRAAALLVVVMWVLVLVVVPVATGAIDATDDITTEPISPDGMPPMGELGNLSGEMPEGMSAEGEFSGEIPTDGEAPGDFSGLMGEAGEQSGDGETSDMEAAPEGEFSGEMGRSPEGETEAVDGAVTDELSGETASEGEVSGGGSSGSAEAQSVPVRPDTAPAASEAESAPVGQSGGSGMKG